MKSVAHKARVLYKREDELLKKIYDLVRNVDNPRLGMAGEAKTRGTHARTNARLAKELIEAEAPWVLTG